MNRIRRFDESNGPCYGKELTTKRGLKFMPLDTDNPTLLDDEDFDDSIPNEDNMIEDEDHDVKKIKKVKRFKNLKEHSTNKILKTKELYDSEYGDNLENLDELIDLYTKKVELLKQHRKGLIQKLTKKSE
jgi:hypothetical protein